MKKIFGIGLVAMQFVLVGCGTRSAAVIDCKNNTPAASSARWACLGEAEKKDELISMQSQCDSYGFQRGTDSYGRCMLQVKQQAIDKGVSNSRIPPAVLRREPPKPINCTTTSLSPGMSTTHCN